MTYHHGDADNQACRDEDHDTFSTKGDVMTSAIAAWKAWGQCLLLFALRPPTTAAEQDEHSDNQRHVDESGYGP